MTAIHIATPIVEEHNSAQSYGRACHVYAEMLKNRVQWDIRPAPRPHQEDSAKYDHHRKQSSDKSAAAISTLSEDMARVFAAVVAIRDG